jgi:glycosyltransferase involved in cell wall biosynthesis
MGNKKIALVNQRYGTEVNGGSEYYTRLLAEMLRADSEVEILTTTALDYTTWANYYKEGLQEIDGIKVRRFPVDCERRLLQFRILNKILKYVKISYFERKWIKAQGPLSGKLIKYIKDHKDEFDVFIFVTYLYYQTVKALPEVAEKAILIPTAHDEPYIYFGIYRNIFMAPKAIIYLTEEERNFVHKTFHNEAVLNDVIGIGVNKPEDISSENFRNKFGVSDDYVIYVGRIDTDKGCKILFDYFGKFLLNNKSSDVKLVLVGKAMMELPNNHNVIPIGFVSEEDKFNAISGSLALILPSAYESLSISVLEAMSLSVPVLVNGKCTVLKGHCDKSEGGLYYHDYDEFEAVMKVILNQNSLEYQKLKENALLYIENNYTWEACRNKFQRILQEL